MTGREFSEILNKLTNRELDQLGRKYAAMVSYSNKKSDNIRWLAQWASKSNGQYKELLRDIEAYNIQKAQGDPNSYELPTSMHEVKEVIRATFPDYKGRKFKVARRDTYHMANYWNGGSRNYVVAYNLATGEASAPDTSTTNPFKKTSHLDVTIPDGVAIVEHDIHRGKDLGIKVFVNSNTFTKSLMGA